MSTFLTRSWVAYLISIIELDRGLRFIIEKGCDWRIMAVYICGIFGIQFIVTGRSIFDDLAEVALAWRGINKSEGAK